MTVQIIRGPNVEAPTPAARPGSLLDVADVREGISWIDSNDMFVSWNCVEAYTTEVCGTDSTPPKIPQGPTTVDGADFAVYLAGRCKPVGFDIASDVERVFDLRESRAVENEFEARVLGVAPAVSGTPVSAAHALAMLENALGDAYAGVPTIHMSPLVATLLVSQNLLVEQGGRFYTVLGSKVVVGTGYDSTALYGTGEVTIFRSEKVNVPSPGLDTNTVNVLVERAYVISGDCVALRIAAPAPQSSSTGGGGGTPTPQTPVNVETGADTLTGPNATWTPPSGNLRNVQVIVTDGSVEVDGDELTAPHTASFDADTNETLTPPTITASSNNDEAVVTWVVIP